MGDPNRITFVPHQCEVIQAVQVSSGGMKIGWITIGPGERILVKTMPDHVVIATSKIVGYRQMLLKYEVAVSFYDEDTRDGEITGISGFPHIVGPFRHKNGVTTTQPGHVAQSPDQSIVVTTRRSCRVGYYHGYRESTRDSRSGHN